MCVYRDYMRPTLILDEKVPLHHRMFFMSSRGTDENNFQKLTQSSIANLLTQTFKDVKVMF